MEGMRSSLKSFVAALVLRAALFAAALVGVLCLGPGMAWAQEPAAAQNPAIVPADRLSVGWWAARHTAIMADVESHPDAQLLMIGDSIINNYDKAQPPDQDFQPIWQQYYAPRKALNLGFSGDTTANVLWRLDHGEVQGLHPKVAVVLIGTNNTAYGQTAEETEEGIDAVVKDLEHRLPETKILLMGILPTKLPSKDQNFDVNAYLGSHYAGGEDPRVSYIDIGVVFYAQGELDTSLFYDPALTPPRPALHPNTAGQRRMASSIEPAVARLMGDTAVKPLPAPPLRTVAHR
jgi:lysophospholipase L1-like esterase